MEKAEDGQLFIISKPKGPLDHVALYVPGRGVFENRYNDKPCWVSLEEFSEGALPRLLPVKDADFPAVLKRIDEIMASGRSYGFISYNCEHAVSEALTGRAASFQVRAAFVMAGLGLLSLALI